MFFVGKKIVILLKVLPKMIETMRSKDERAKCFELKEGRKSMVPTSLNTESKLAMAEDFRREFIHLSNTCLL